MGSLPDQTQAGELKSSPNLWVTGLGSQYPPYLMGPEKLESFAKRFYNVEKPGLKKLLQINRTTGIDTRASIRDWESGSNFANRSESPSIIELDDFFRTTGVELAAQACRKALKEWGGTVAGITHTVAVTCTNQGNPGYDILVARRLGITAERILLHGVGCAGGLAILRTAAQLACSATSRGRPARILAFACELCSPNVRHDLDEAAACENTDEVGIAGALFADGAAAFVLCNEAGMANDDGSGATGMLQLLEWGNATIPDSMQHMGFYADPIGFRTVLTRDVPSFTAKAIQPMFESLLPSFHKQTGLQDVADFDWALHPGGEAIITGAQAALGLTDGQVRATKQIYRTRGNSSSPTVLAVLDLLRRADMGHGKDAVVATSFGPGLCIEMAMFIRCRTQD